MAEKLLKRYLFAGDFDQTLSFNDSGYILSELLGIPTEEFERKAAGMAKLNLVQQARNSLICCYTIPNSEAASAEAISTKSANASA